MRLPPVHLVSLGCPKNEVDAEVMAGLLQKEGFPLTGRPEEAAVILVNTCAFVLPAKEEAIAEILEAARRKTTGACRFLVVAGCLAQRYGETLARALPEVDLFVGIEGIPHVAERLRRLVAGDPPGPFRPHRRPTFLMTASSPRLREGAPAWAYLKLADGCSHRCTYCVIPAIRGRARSRSRDDLLEEAEGLVRSGVRELILVAQDTTSWGRDLQPRDRLSRLLEDLASLGDLRWIRLLYGHPALLTRDLLDAMTREGKVCPYLDLPAQHIDDRILRAMGRAGDSRAIRGALALARSVLPGMAVRTSLIVGFPGETRSRFDKLLAFVREARFDHLGVFAYSQEEGTPAARLSGRVPAGEATRRVEAVLAEQAAVSAEINASLVDTVQEVLVEGVEETAHGPRLWGRCRRQAPEIDGITWLTGQNLRPGDFVLCRITDADTYDLYGRVEGGATAAALP